MSVIIFSFPPKISTIYYYSSKPLRNKVIWKKGCSFSEDIYNRMYQLKNGELVCAVLNNKKFRKW
ncbi:hypothetical protein FH008_16015 [Listeria monocytogenes]|nr:hypothetical protein [Listeria monocytogenes]EBF5152619.1 hypothetical protein [Listeria monocytogenes]